MYFGAEITIITATQDRFRQKHAWQHFKTNTFFFFLFRMKLLPCTTQVLKGISGSP